MGVTSPSYPEVSRSEIIHEIVFLYATFLEKYNLLDS